MKKKWSLWLVGLFLLMATGVAVAANSYGLVDHPAVLSGRVTSQGLVTVGTQVREGDVLVNVETLVGVAPTSRAKVSGVVAEVLVTPGSMVKTGAIVVRVEPAKL